MRLGGYLDPYGDKQTEPDPENPLMYCLPAANGSGKDLVLIAAFAVWFALYGLRNFCFITSASDDQIRTQTQPHIKALCEAANKHFGKIFRSVDKYHVCTQTASEIKLFVTDEAGRAEGLHPRFGGKMALVFNEAKTIPPDLWEAYSRCTGYSYWLEISSPGIKSGHFFQSSLDAIRYPAPTQLGKYYFRRITAYECPHIAKSHIERMRLTQTPEWFKSSVEAEYSDFGTDNVIKEFLWTATAKFVPESETHSGYAIGADYAAGGDECSFYLRKGYKIIDELHFRQSDTTITANVFDTKFNYIKFEDYLFFADDGNIGHSINDMLIRMGWKITRCHNQGSARDKSQFLNLGAESYFHVRRLLENHAIPSKTNDPILTRQITSRIANNLDGGKWRLEDKKDHITRHKESPDRSDAYVLTYYSYPIILTELPGSKPKPPEESFWEMKRRIEWGPRKSTLYNSTNYGNASRNRKSFIVNV
jgi:hypothetical protein